MKEIDSAISRKMKKLNNKLFLALINGTRLFFGTEEVIHNLKFKDILSLVGSYFSSMRNQLRTLGRLYQTYY